MCLALSTLSFLLGEELPREVIQWVILRVLLVLIVGASALVKNVFFKRPWHCYLDIELFQSNYNGMQFCFTEATFNVYLKRIGLICKQEYFKWWKQWRKKTCTYKINLAEATFCISKLMVKAVYCAWMFPISCYFVLLRRTTLKVYTPVYFKVHTGFWNCVLCVLYVICVLYVCYMLYVCFYVICVFYVCYMLYVHFMCVLCVFYACNMFYVCYMCVLYV